MSKFVLSGCRVFAGGCDLTSVASKAEITADVESKDVTNFGSGGAREVIGGLAQTAIAAEGFWEALDLSKVDDSLWAAAGTVGPWTLTPATANVGDVAYPLSALETKYQVGGSVGDVAPWQASAVGNRPLVRGQIAHPPGTARTASGTGTGVQLAATPAGGFIYCNLHVLSVAGTGSPTLTVTVQSDTSNAFSAPVTVATFTAATAIGGQHVRVAGPATNTWYRVIWTISGTTPSFLFVASLGVK